MHRHGTEKSTRILGISVGLAILVNFPAQRSHSATPTVKLPGPYPYETPVQVPAPPPVSDSSPLPAPAPFPYPESAPPLPAGHYSRAADAQRPLTAKAVRKAAFKYNGVPNFCGFLAALPADVSVFDPKLGEARALVKGGRVVRKNVTWLRKHTHATGHE